MPVCGLAMAAGASFVASTTVYHALEMDRMIEQAIGKDGFSLVEVASYCHTTYGRLNKLGSAVEMMRQLKENSVTLQAAEKLPPEERESKIIRGVLCDQDRPGFIERYDRMVAALQADHNAGKDEAR
jgi:2-oxoglutarate/2-oxoacid ferredoxin oxidoreductase subunit beta